MAVVQAIDHPPMRLRLRVRGTVQGVGFRPYVYGLAQSLHLSGFVLNDGNGVVVEIEGADTRLFVDRLQNEAPPLARIDAVDIEAVVPLGQRGFSILASAAGAVQTRIPADAAICPECLNDLFNPNSRFHLYPFVTCTHCGPRYTMTSALPYDRPQTSMAGFPLCPACAQDYADPASRRFHAESLACPVCGPQLDRSVDDILACLERGQIVALKGIGGYHLLCDARNPQAVERLRLRKNRDAKPFAVMVGDLDAVRSVAYVSEAEQRLLTDRSRPIVVLESRHTLAESVAPNLGRVGVVLPYTPLHYLIFQPVAGFGPARALVVTSANPGGEPLVIDDQDAQLRLQSIADLIVGHDRPIVARADDSVMAVHQSGPVFLRRSRGFVPDPIDLGCDGPSVLAVGAHLKVTVTVTRGREAFVSPHVGSMDNIATVGFFEETVKHMLALTGVKPEKILCDLHPDLFTTRFAESFGVPVMQVQHHAAHVAAVAAEHQAGGPILGAALDGHGYGEDGTAWGGELILLDGAKWQRVGHLRPMPMPGGDRAAKEPWRMGVSALSQTGLLDDRFDDIPGAKDLIRMMPRLTMPGTSSLGRLFDAASAILGLCQVQGYEGQAAMELEALVKTPVALDDGFTLTAGRLDFLPLFSALAERGITPAQGADLFHGTLAAGLTQWIAQAAQRQKAAAVALGGGCMTNRILSDSLVSMLGRLGLSVLVPSKVPAGDGGLSLGQAFMGRL